MIWLSKYLSLCIKHNFSESLWWALGGWDRWERTGLPRCILTDAALSQKLVDGSSAKYSAQIRQMLSHELYPYPSSSLWWGVRVLVHFCYKDVVIKRCQKVPLLWCFYTAETEWPELVLSSSILWLKNPHFSFFSSLSCRLQPVS